MAIEIDATHQEGLNMRWTFYKMFYTYKQAYEQLLIKITFLFYMLYKQNFK